MSKFAALEMKSGETPHDTIEAFYKYAEGMGLAFKYLLPYGQMTIGSIKLLRFQTDCPSLETLVPFMQEDNRSCVVPNTTGYAVHTQTTVGVVPVTKMQSAKLPGYNRKYRGTSDKFWKRQFTK